MRVSCSLGSLLSVNQVIDCSKILSNTNVDTIWIPETWGMENFSMLAAISANTTSKIGSSIINTYSRSPATVAMGAATIDILSGNRMVLGLGTSSAEIVENLHGYKFAEPLQRIKEYVQIIRLILSGEQVNFAGSIFNLKNFSLLIKPSRKSIPIYLAAVNQKMVNLAWDIGDGVIFYLRPLNEIKTTIAKMQSRKNIDVACQIITCVAKDSDIAASRAKKTIAFYVAVGKIYRDFLAKNGFKNDVNNIFDEFQKSGLESIHELVSDSMLHSLAISGTIPECKKQLEQFTDAGINLPILQFNPVGETMESCELLKTFLEQ